MRWWHPVIAPVGQAGSIRGASTHFPQPPMPLLGLPVGASAGQALSAPGQLVSESRMCRRQIRRQARTLGHCSAEAAVLALRPVSLDTLSRREEFERPTWSRHTITANCDQRAAQSLSTRPTERKSKELAFPLVAGWFQGWRSHRWAGSSPLTISWRSPSIHGSQI